MIGSRAVPPLMEPLGWDVLYMELAGREEAAVSLEMEERKEKSSLAIA